MMIGVGKRRHEKGGIVYDRYFSLDGTIFAGIEQCFW